MVAPIVLDPFQKLTDGLVFDGMLGPKRPKVFNGESGDWFVWGSFESLPQSGRTVQAQVALLRKPQDDGSLWAEISFDLSAWRHIEGSGWYSDCHLIGKVAGRRFLKSELLSQDWILTNLYSAQATNRNLLDEMDHRLFRLGFSVEHSA